MGNILLIQPYAYSKFPGMPMGLVAVASAIEQAGHEVRALHLHATPKTERELEEFIEKGSYTHVCIGGTSPSQPESYDLARFVKRVSPKIMIIKGGPHETFYAEKTAAHPEIDYVLKGAGENLPQIIAGIKNGRFTSKVIKGLLVDSSKTTLSNSPPQNTLQFDIQEAPLPNRQLLYQQNQRYYDFLGVPTAQTRSFRGCVFHCTYCAQNALRDTYLHYPWSFIERDLQQLTDQGFKAIYWDDAIFTLKKRRVFQLLDILRKYKFEPMGCITRAGINTDEEVFQKMYDVGFRLLWLSLESGNPTIRQQSLGRTITGTSDVKDAVQTARQIGFSTFVNIIVGSPGETDKTIDDTIKALLEIKPNGVSASVYTMYPGVPGCTEGTYEEPINRNDPRLKVFDEGFGGHILVDAGQAVEWHDKISSEIGQKGIRMLSIEECFTPATFVNS